MVDLTAIKEAFRLARDGVATETVLPPSGPQGGAGETPDLERPDGATMAGVGDRLARIEQQLHVPSMVFSYNGQTGDAITDPAGQLYADNDTHVLPFEAAWVTIQIEGGDNGFVIGADSIMPIERPSTFGAYIQIANPDRPKWTNPEILIMGGGPPETYHIRCTAIRIRGRSDRTTYRITATG